MEEWNYEVNDELGHTPENVTYGSKKMIWWICKEKGHVFDMKPNSRTNSTRPQNCPYCSNQRVCIDNCLATVNPVLATQWDYERNIDTPFDVLAHTGQERYWICSENSEHKWKTKVNDRWYHGCPYCSGSSPTKERGIEVNAPYLLQEWSVNNEIYPSDFNVGSHQNVLWKCKTCSHEWSQTIKNRANGSGCPNCDNMRKTSFPEYTVKYYLSKIMETAHRKIIDGDEVDVWLPEHRISIEYDGVYYHKSKHQKDYEKTARLNQFSDSVIRIRESGLEEIEGCHNIIFDFTREESFPQMIEEVVSVVNSKTGNYYVCPDVDVGRDRLYILESLRLHEEEESFVHSHPENAQLWNYEKNGDINPLSLLPMSSVEVNWKCEWGHEWNESLLIKNRTVGCLYCQKERVSETYNLYANNKSLCVQWDYEKNDQHPSYYLPSAHDKVWWKCENGHSWKASINNRNSKKPSGCRECWKESLKQKTIIRNGE